MNIEAAHAKVFTGTNREYTELVENGIFPADPNVPFDAGFLNDAGLIQNILMEKFASVAFINSRSGAARANHYHKTDWHYTLVANGKVCYFYRPVGSAKEPEMFVAHPGTMFFTPPMMEHAMFFPVLTDIFTFSRNIRDTEHHEQDVVRLDPPLVHSSNF